MNKKLLYFICLLTISFANAQLNSLALVGSGTTQGWPNDPQVDAHQFSTSNGVDWTLTNITLLNGAVKFRGNNTWALPYNWGGTTFPSGTATIDGNGITSATGVYNVSFNSSTGVYNFIVQQSTFPVIGLIGTATPGGWTTDTDMATVDGINYTISRVPLINGAIKFRQDHTWTPTTNWGGNTFPSGTGIVDGPAITVPTAGKYNVSFNRNTGVYSFGFPTVAIIGPGAGGWPNDPQIDANQLSTTDGITYSKNSITLVADNAKFRANNSWAVNWGAIDFPSGTAVLDSQASFLCVAGTYSVTFNYDSGAYNFGTPLSTKQFNTTKFIVYPNPTQNEWNFTTANEVIETIQIVDLLGKTVLTITPKNNNVTIDASNLAKGIYVAKIMTSTTTGSLKLIKS